MLFAGIREAPLGSLLNGTNSMIRLKLNYK
jgi:hypothetical protein